MKKIIITIISIAVILVGYWLISPFFINVRVSETLPAELAKLAEMQTTQTSKQMSILSGTFVGFDKIHNGTGTASIYSFESSSGEGEGEVEAIKNILRFEEGFQVNNGPDLYVGFGKNGQYVKGSEISKLKGNIGSQNYVIPAGVDIDQYDSVWVWCKAFSTPFIKADLKKVSVDSDKVDNNGTSNAKITYTNATDDLIQVELPFPGAVVGKDFNVIGKARGNWFFEASFPIEVLDKDGKTLVIGIAQPQNGEDWMTTNFVNFKSDIKVPQTYIGPATLVLRKDNASGLPEHNASMSFPITIEY